MRLDKVTLGVVLELQSPSMAVTMARGKAYDLRPQPCRRDRRAQVQDLGDPRGCKPSLTPPWRNNASGRKPAFKWADRAV